MAVSTNLEENLNKILWYIEQGNTDFLLFPEMSLTGWRGDFNDAVTEQACRQIAKACRLAYVTAVVGLGVKIEGKTYIQSRIFTYEGKTLGTHEKLVPTLNDRKFCGPGEELRVFKNHGITFGCLIGNDLWVAPGYGPYPDPRLTYKLKKLGADVIFHSMNSGSDEMYAPYYESNLALRARESAQYIFTANAEDPNGPLNAPTGIVAPSGEWRVRLPRTGEHRYFHDMEVETE
jgi:predicted amidohydrolase